MNTEKIEKYKLVIERLIKGNQVNKSAPNNYIKNDVGIFLDNMLERINDGILFKRMEVETPLCSIKLNTTKGNYDTIYMKLECKFAGESNEDARGMYILESHSSENETIEVDYIEENVHSYEEYRKSITTLKDIVENTDIDAFFRNVSDETRIKNKNIINGVMRFLLENAENGVPVWYMKSKLVNGEINVSVHNLDKPYATLMIDLNGMKYTLTSTPIEKD